MCHRKSRVIAKCRQTLKHRVDHFKSLVNLLPHFGTGQDNLAGNENEEHNLGLDHTINQTREEFGLIGAEIVMARGKTFETDGELDVT